MYYKSPWEMLIFVFKYVFVSFFDSVSYMFQNLELDRKVIRYSPLYISLLSLSPSFSLPLSDAVS